MEQNIFIKEWETLLIKQCLERNAHKKNIYICSPLKADTIEGIFNNMEKARRYMFYAQSNLDVAAHAPHAYLPIILNDNIPSERATALQFGLNVLDKCDELYVCGDRISNGMRNEISYAAKHNIKIRTFNEQIYEEVTNLLGDKGTVVLDTEQKFFYKEDDVEVLGNNVQVYVGRA